MPLVRIDLREGKPQDYKVAIEEIAWDRAIRRSLLSPPSLEDGHSAQQ
jgi:hypothetical protein